MKHLFKIMAVVLAALTISAASSMVAGAAKKNGVQIKVIGCNGSDCNNIAKILSKACKGNKCTFTTKKLNGYCPDGNCSTKMPVGTAKPAASAVSAPQSSEFNTTYEADVLRLVNIERNKNGLSSLTKDSGATNVAHLRAKEILKSFSHTRPDGSSCFTAAKELGVTYRTAGENIAYGYSTPEQVVKGWMNSEGHRKNILSDSFKKIGIGCYKSGNTLYWSQFFIG